MDVDSKGFVYVGRDTVRCDQTGKQVGMVVRVPGRNRDLAGTAGQARLGPARVPGRERPSLGVPAQPAAGTPADRPPTAAVAAYRAKCRRARR
jgi:hypothetical protein